MTNEQNLRLWCKAAIEAGHLHLGTDLTAQQFRDELNRLSLLLDPPPTVDEPITIDK